MNWARSLITFVSNALLSERLRAYVGVLVVGSGARMFGLASQFVVLVMLSRFLSKDSFGNLMTAFGFYRLAGLALGVGGSLVLLYHVSRHRNDEQAEIRLQRFSAFAGAVPSGLLALATIIAARPIAAALGKPELAAWLQQLAPFLVFTTLLVITTGALEGRSRVTESIFWGEVAPNAVRMVLLPAIFLLDLPQAYVAHALTLSVMLPWLWLARRMLKRSARGWRPWSGWDYSYCGRFVVATLFANQLSAADIVVASVLFPSTLVADYAVAARLATLFTFFELALLKRFAPAAGRLLHVEDQPGLRREFEVCRRLTIGCVAFTVAGVLLLAPLLLPMLGNYTSARPLLLWLAIPSFIAAFYAVADRLLIIAGQANVALLVTASSFLVLISIPWALAPWLGAVAIPAAMIVSIVLINPIVAVRARQLIGVRTLAPRDGVLMVCGCGALAASAMTDSYPIIALGCCVLAAIGAYYVTTASMRSAADRYDTSVCPAAGRDAGRSRRLAPEIASQ